MANSDCQMTSDLNTVREGLLGWKTYVRRYMELVMVYQRPTILVIIDFVHLLRM